MHTCSTTRACEGERWTWKVEDLWEAARDLPVHELDIPAVTEITDLLESPVGHVWGSEGEFTFWNLLEHMERVLEADLSYPILASPEGSILDGIHRLVKARLYDKTVRWQQFEEWPEPWKREKVTAPTDCPERDEQCDPQCAVWATGDHRCRTEWE